MNLQDIVFLALGILVMLFALVWGARLGAQPVEFGIGKLGLNLKADRLTVIFSLGFLMAGVGVFFRYRGYEAQVANLKSDVARLEGNLSQVSKTMEKLTSDLQGLKDYDLGLNLAFPAGVDPRQLNIQVYTQKSGDQGFSLRDIRPQTDIGGTWVYLNSLSRGEKIKITARAPDATTWVSDLEIPKTQVQMVRTQGER